MPGYTVKYSIDVINQYCENPKLCSADQIQGVINDARTHYEFGIASKQWYDYVVMKLSPYIK